MTTATLVPDLAIGFAETLSTTIESGKVEELSETEISAAITASQFLSQLFAAAHKSIETALSQGVDARAFALKYESAVNEMEPIRKTIEEVVSNARSRHLPASAEPFVASYKELARDIASLQQFLRAAIAKANSPTRPIDWDRAKEIEAAFDRGETKPLFFIDHQ